MAEILIQLENVKTYFPYEKSTWGKPLSYIRAVDGISLDIYQGETLGVVGESGCGKSTLGRAILHTAPLTSGTVRFKGQNLNCLNRKNMRPFRAKMQMVFEQSDDLFNPQMTVLQILTEALNICEGLHKEDYLDQASELLAMVDLRIEYLFQSPHALSSGEQLRLSIARALATQPDFIIFDDPTRTVGISIQTQILNLMEVLKNKLNLTYLFISNDLSVLAPACDRIAVMYAGEIVEICKAETILSTSRHPYTKWLCDTAPLVDPRILQTFPSIPGEIPHLAFPPTGCRFHPRCIHHNERCRETSPENTYLSDVESVRCHLQEKLWQEQTLIETQK